MELSSDTFNFKKPIVWVSYNTNRQSSQNVILKSGKQACVPVCVCDGSTGLSAQFRDSFCILTKQKGRETIINQMSGLIAKMTWYSLVNMC